MAQTVIVAYTDIFQTRVITTLVGLHPTLTVTNPYITVTIFYSVTATVLTEAPLLSTTILSAESRSFIPTKTIISTISTTTFQANVPLTIIPAIQLPPQTTTLELSPSSPGTLQTSTHSQPASPASSTFSSSTSGATSKHTPGPQSNTGAIAGTAVGCLIGGALIASLLIWLFMSSRRKKRRPRDVFAEHQPSSRNVNQEMTLQPELPA
jgi:hypothetical protein